MLTCFFVGYTCCVQLDEIGGQPYPIAFEFHMETAAMAFLQYYSLQELL